MWGLFTAFSVVVNLSILKQQGIQLLFFAWKCLAAIMKEAHLNIYPYVSILKKYN